MKTLTISIALATYNGGRYIREQIESLISQTIRPNEIIVSDDGSTDDTLDIVHDSLLCSGIPFKIIYNAGRRGFRDNFMNATSHCAGDLIAFCDQDDVWHKNKLETMLPAFEDEKVLLAYHNALVTDQALKPVRPLFSDAAEVERVAPDRFEPWIGGYGFTQIFRSDLKVADSFWAESIDQDHMANMSHDHWYMLLAKSLGRVAYFDDCLALYRQHGNNAMGAGTKPSLKERVLAVIIKDVSWEQRALQAALFRANLFIRLHGILGPNSKINAKMAHRDFQMLASKLERRIAIYTGRSFSDRATSLYRSYKVSDYVMGKSHLRPMIVIMRDIFRGVIMRQG